MCIFNFFWTRPCPHCRRVRPFIESLPTQYPWLALHSHDLSQDMAAGLRYARMAEALGESARAVPALLFCGRMLI
ncbi:MAG: thioredoxin family protein [Candidatus Competibacteraceae bacterium]|nr:thioredoxin family protein [Candidatus Competibacteraceae bacterium]